MVNLYELGMSVVLMVQRSGGMAVSTLEISIIPGQRRILSADHAVLVLEH